MKKYLLFAATAAMMLASCSSEVDFTQESLQQANAENAATPVQFGTYLGNSATTRAGVLGGITNTDILKGTSTTVGANASTAGVGFGVFGYQISGSSNTWSSAGSSATPNFMYNQQVKWNSTSNAWEYDPIKYWPNGTDAANASTGPSSTATSTNTDKLSFFAYAPYVELTATDLSGVGITKINGYAQKGGAASNGNQKTGNPTVEYKLDVANLHTAANVDLLWGTRGAATYSETDGTDNTGAIGTDYNTDLTKQTVNETVDFNFKHALAKIGGKNGLKIVADIDGNGAGLVGFGSLDAKTCITVRSITIKNVGSKDFKESGTFDLATGTWSDLTNASTQPNEGALINKTIQDGNSSTVKMNGEIYNATGPTYSSGWPSAGVTTTAKDVYATDVQDDAFYLIPGSSVTLQVAINYDITTYDENIKDNYVKINQTITNNVTVAVPTTATNKYYTLVLHLGLTSVKFSAEVADWENASSDPTTAEEIWLPSNVVDESTSVSLASGSGATVNTAAATTAYTITVTGLTSSQEWTAAVASGDATISTTSGTTASTSQEVSVTLVENTSTSATKENVITFTCNGTTTTITIISAKATS